MTISRNHNYLLILISLALLLKYSNFYPLLILIVSIFLFFQENDYNFYKSYCSIITGIKKYKFFASICLILSFIYAIKIFEFDNGISIHKNIFNPSVFFDFVNISIFFILILSWTLILSQKIVIYISKGFYIFIIICLFDLLIDFYTDYSFLRGYFSFETRSSSIMAQPQLGAYIFMIFTFCLVAYLKFKHEYNILLLWVITFIIILFTVNRIPLFFHIVNFCIIIVNIFTIEKNFKNFLKKISIYIFSIFLITIYFFNVNQNEVKNLIKSQIVYPIIKTLNTERYRELNTLLKLSAYAFHYNKFYKKKEDSLNYVANVKNYDLYGLDKLIEAYQTKNLRNLTAADQIFLSLERKNLSENFEAIPGDVDKNDFYELDKVATTQKCRRLELLLINSKFIFYGKNYFGVRQDLLTTEWHDFRTKKCLFEKLKHPHSILFELIHYFGIIFFIFLVLPYSIYLFLNQSYSIIFILGMLFSPSGIGSLTSSSFSILLSLLIGVCIKKNIEK